ncbi:ribonuclease III [Rhodococcus antarcticus]|uniref:Ribonuclease 3 n=1 Tax=Rhodococcus antarcticus TaxID=2987751 RepID=A0ABY6P2E7_9NOCA|nr:ribonuclease III [Rhodococcus antarcticus]UZJ25698.1 ribonuclease III [Rhodococcus antarcticus]
MKREAGAATDRGPLLDSLGVQLDAELLTLALTHRSFAYENGGLPTNERLEFLGDAVLGLAVTERLYRSHPDFSEGVLAKIRASVVNMHALAGVARAIGDGGLGGYLLLGRGEELTGGRDKTSILADATESLLGAVFVEHGIDAARGVVDRLFAALLAEGPLLGAGLDWKTSLQELTSERGLGVPVYEVTSDGPDHLKEFTAQVLVVGDSLGTGTGRSKKEAEQQAASSAWRALSVGNPGTEPELEPGTESGSELGPGTDGGAPAGA